MRLTSHDKCPSFGAGHTRAALLPPNNIFSAENFPTDPDVIPTEWNGYLLDAGESANCVVCNIIVIMEDVNAFRGRRPFPRVWSPNTFPNIRLSSGIAAVNRAHWLIVTNFHFYLTFSHRPQRLVSSSSIRAKPGFRVNPLHHSHLLLPME